MTAGSRRRGPSQGPAAGPPPVLWRHLAATKRHRRPGRQGAIRVPVRAVTSAALGAVWTIIVGSIAAIVAALSAAVAAPTALPVPDTSGAAAGAVRVVPVAISPATAAAAMLTGAAGIAVALAADCSLCADRCCHCSDRCPRYWHGLSWFGHSWCCSRGYCCSCHHRWQY